MQWSCMWMYFWGSYFAQWGKTLGQKILFNFCPRFPEVNLNMVEWSVYMEAIKLNKRKVVSLIDLGWKSLTLVS